MIRLALVSDSHERVPAGFPERIRNCDALCHMGDMASDGEAIAREAGLRLYAVHGNCDGFSSAPAEQTITLAGYKILMCHGHRLGVKYSMTALSLRAREVGADIVLYGHTHVPMTERDGGILFVNPGALCLGRYAVLEFRENGPVSLMKIL